MPFANIPSDVILLTGDGTTDGTVTVATTNVPKPGTIVNLYSSVAGGIECIVVKADTSTGILHMRPRPSGSADDSGAVSAANRTQRLQYGLGSADLSAWKVVDIAALMIEAQIIPVQPLFCSQA